MTDPLSLKVVSAQGVLLDEKADYICLPAEDGTIGVLKGHAPMIVSLKAGDIKYRGSTGESAFHLDRGIAEIKDNRVVIISG